MWVSLSPSPFKGEIILKTRVCNKKKRGRGALALALALGIFALSLSGCRANQKEEAEIPPGSGSSQASAAAGAKALTVCLDPATDPKAFQKAFEESAKLVPGLQEAFTLTVESVPGGFCPLGGLPAHPRLPGCER